jgi:hypothetical protein
MALAYYMTHPQAMNAIRFTVYDGDDGGLVIVDHNAGKGSKLTLDVPEARQHWLALRRQGWQQTELVGHPTRV